MPAAAIMMRRVMRRGRIFRRFLVGWFLIRRLLVRWFRIFIAVAIAIIRVAGFVLPLSLHSAYAAHRSPATLQLVFSLVAYLLQFKFLLGLQSAAGVGALAVAVPALRQFSILAPVQRVHLVIHIFFQVAAGIGSFRIARVQL